MDAFLADFDLSFAKLLGGCGTTAATRSPGEKALAHYAWLRIDAHTERLVFSDSLDITTALCIFDTLADRTQLGFSIGTHLTNDAGLTPLNRVMKLTAANGQLVAMLADSPAKALCSGQR